MENNQVSFDKYVDFVDRVTSDASKDFLALSDRLVELDEKGANIERLLTGAVGAAAESGELLEVVKKLIFQGKNWNEETKFHLKRELGDLIWYIAQICIALDTSLDEIVKMNIEKLLKRYPEGYFDAFYSENRERSDI
jgi:NTP pyrophosphatase (non-canonical NTP hydrolase)